MPVDQTIVSGTLLTVAAIMIFLAGRKENQGKTVLFFTFSTLGAVSFFFFLESISGLQRGMYDTSLPETEVIHRTTSCIQGRYFAYFTTIKKGWIEPHYFRKVGKCPPLRFMINKKGEYKPVHFAQSERKYHFNIPDPKPIIPKIKS